MIPLGGTGWQVWRSARLRAAGFPAAGLDRLAAPGCAKVADVHLGGAADRAEFDAMFAETTAGQSALLCEIAADPLFREAVTWQSLDSVLALDGLARTGPTGPRNKRRREREIAVTRYWQRYCGKNDTIGFFGPMCWMEFAPTGPAADARPGPGLVRDRVVDLEWRALAAFAGRLAADPRFRPWLAVRRAPHLALDGTTLLRVGAKPEPLPAATAALLVLADGTRSAAAIVADLLDSSGLRKETDVYLLLDRLEEQGLVHWGISLPLSITAEGHLRERLAAIGDPELRAEADTMMRRLATARDELAAAAGDPAAVHTAMRRLEETFVELTGGAAKHRPGATYAGRGVAYEDTRRDLELTIGASVLSAIAPALVPLLHIARWLTAELARECGLVVRELYEDAVRATDSDTVPFGELWVLARGVMVGGGAPTTGVMSEFARRWAAVVGPAGNGEVRLDSADLARTVTRVFPAAAPGWPAARLHSPDIQLCAGSVEALARGDFTAVLGELHIASVTCVSGMAVRFHPEPEELRAALRRDIGGRVLLLYPPEEPGVTARMTDALGGDVLLAYTAAPTPTLDGVLPLAALTASLVDGEVIARSPDGRRWPALELLGPLLSELASDAFKLAGSGAYTPRVNVDNLVVQRETWRTTVGASGLAGPAGESDRYLAARRWRAELGLPERVFARVGTEIKPCFVDLTSPASVASFVAMVRAAHRTGEDVPLTVSELLPGPDQAWVPDAAGRRYASELRMVVRDPVPAAGADGVR